MDALGEGPEVLCVQGSHAWLFLSKPHQSTSSVKSTKAETVPPKFKNPSHQEVSIPKPYDELPNLEDE